MEKLISLPFENENLGSEALSPTKRIRSAAFIGGACVRYSLEIPEEIADPTPAIILDGFGAKKWAYDNLRHELALLGKPSISVTPPITHFTMQDLNPKNLLHPESLLSKGAWSVIRDIREHHRNSQVIDVEKFDGIGHSMGGYTLVNMTKAKPFVIKNMILLQAAGLENHHNTFNFAARAPGFFVHEFVPSITHSELNFSKGYLHVARSEMNYLAANPIRIVREGLAVSNADVRKDVRNLKSTHGIGVAAILGTQDRLLPPERTLQAARDLFDYHIILEGGHLLPQTQPARVASAITGILHKLNDPGRINSLPASA